MIGVIAAGGLGTRLLPVTKVVNKHLLPVYNLPMIYYPLQTLLHIGASEVVVVSTQKGIDDIRTLLSSESIGVGVHYAVQAKPKGAADALLCAREFVKNEGIAFILGDNVFLGDCHGRLWFDRARQPRRPRGDGGGDRRPFYYNGAVIFAKKTDTPSAFGVAELDEDGKLLSIEEKPDTPKRSFDGCYYAVTGLYLYDNSVFSIIERLKPSKRSEMEMCDVNRAYMERGQLSITVLGDDVFWQDAGTPDGLLAASNAAKMRGDTAYRGEV